MTNKYASTRKLYYEKNKQKINQRNRELYLLKKEEILQKHKEYRSLNKEEINLKDRERYLLRKHDAHYQENRKNYRSLKKQEANARTAKRKKNDPAYKYTCLLRRRINNIYKGRNKSGSAVQDLGCTPSELKQYLESKFKPGMTHENHGQWHIDHIKPLALFDLTDREQFLQACHYTNLQPLWASENLSKGAK